jgi:hypothetical protein
MTKATAKARLVKRCIESVLTEEEKQKRRSDPAQILQE